MVAFTQWPHTVLKPPSAARYLKASGLGNLKVYPSGSVMARSACQRRCPAPSGTLPGWKGKADSHGSLGPQVLLSWLLHTMVLASPCTLKGGLKYRHMLLPRFSTKLLASGPSCPHSEIQVGGDQIT